MKEKIDFRIHRWVVFFVSFVFSIGFVAISANAAPITISYLTPWPANAYDSANFINYIKTVQQEADKKFPGQLKLVFKGGPEVVNTFEQVEALRKGVIQMLLSAPSYYSSAMPELDLLGLTSMKPWEQRATGLFKYIDKLHNEKVNAHYLAQSGIGVPFQIHLSKPIKTLDDMKGLKLRVSPTNIPFMKEVGAAPVGMPPSDIYTAMERGVVQGFILPAYTAKDFGLVKVTKYLVKQGTYFPTNSWLINLDVWNKLSKELQEFMDQKAQAYERINFGQIAARNADEMKYFQKQGIKIINLAPEEAAKLKEIANEKLIEAIDEKAPKETLKILSYLVQ